MRVIGIGFLLLTGGALADDQKSEREILAIEIAAAYHCEPVLDRPGLTEHVAAAGRASLLAGGHDAVELDQMISDLRAVLEDGGLATVEHFFCETLLRDYL